MRYEPYKGRYRSSTRPQYKTRPQMDICGLGSNSSINTLERISPERFFNTIVENIPGKKSVIYESLKKFGKFNMIDNIVTDNDLFEEPIKAFQNLWKFTGYIYIFQNYRGRRHVYMYKIIHDSFIKLNETETQRILQNDSTLFYNY
jgi:hypothetical protein